MEESTSGHPSSIPNMQEMHDQITYKTRLNVLTGKWSPDPKDREMILAFRKQRKSPKAFLKTWKKGAWNGGK